MDEHKENILEYAFTKYVETSVIRARNHYLKRLFSVLDWECLSENEAIHEAFSVLKQQEINIDNLQNISWNPDDIRAYLKNILDYKFVRALKKLNDVELQIVYARVYREMSFADMEKILKMDKKQITKKYSYARKKLRKELKKDE